ncbi:hypothetical protein CANARDRAFT_28395 [[Candida] arabinofermentans NRRL YB-2248]|uniref:mRNA 3'-end-processing protein RNA14 n=1 Tax=[Candida] arabinofermentans NRRL YB-2248 TaxID=983967 RepID=A0A1E4T1L1_9ASCO|nr:hypothetical protein CANARDRAFT_28395 [[Candida] arabinofermentans NRRL YB-2248]
MTDSKRRKLTSSGVLKTGGNTIDDLKTDLEKDKLDYSKWMELIEAVNKTTDSDKIVETYKSYLSIFKNDGDVWKKYIGFELSRGNHSEVESLFGQNLTQIYNVELWRLYIEYVRTVNDIVTGGEQAMNVVTKAFNFAIDNVGIDFLSAQPLWNDYLKFLNEWSPLTTNEIRTKTERQRNLLKRMISTPLLHLEDNWKTYLDFENDVNQSTARKYINERSPEYMKLRPFNTELIHLTSSIKYNPDKINSKRQVQLWKNWINWEKLNKMNLPSDILDKRINYVYRKSTEYLRFQPEVWYNYSVYLASKNNTDMASSIIQTGLLVNPESFSLRFNHSNQLEKIGDVELVKETWMELIDSLTAKYESETITEEHKLIIGRCVSRAYSCLMGAYKRMVGTTKARAIFSMARKFKGVTWHVFVDYAMMEYNSNDLKIALRSFELALKYFGKEFGFVDTYLDFLISQKDLANSKKAFEISLINFKDQKEYLIKIFKKFMKIEMAFGDVNSIKLLEKRFCEVLPDETPFVLASSAFEDNDNFSAVKMIDEYGIYNKHTEPDLNDNYSSSSAAGNSNQSENYDIEEETLANIRSENKGPFVVRDEVYNLLRVLPKAEYYADKPAIFDPKKAVEFFQNIEL